MYVRKEGAVMNYVENILFAVHYMYHVVSLLLTDLQQVVLSSVHDAFNDIGKYEEISDWKCNYDK